MRIAPVGLLYHDDMERLTEVARKSSTITHTHPIGIGGAMLQAFSVARALSLDRNAGTKRNGEIFIERLREFSVGMAEPYPERIELIAEFLTSEPGAREIVSRLGNNVVSVNSVPTALYCALRHLDDFRSGVLMAVNLGGDTDTIGAMTGAILGAYNGVDSIPREWYDELENGAKGRDYIVTLAGKLFDRKVVFGNESI